MEFTKAKSASDLPADEYLTPDEVLQLQHVLCERGNTLLAAAQNNLGELTEEHVPEADSIDQASAESSRDWTLRLASRERYMMGKIRHSLHTIDEGEYGTCESCGESITLKRLLVRPVARMCIDCKTQAEQLERGSRAF